ncbi:hypothetical protein LCGC14_0374350 [marine sediment metagenome]|uniref:Uncharacterized protein n=1 Tax=marine sediment metagenome TaxID=412755 RepID=A0A0F9T459_9ZZZZ
MSEGTQQSKINESNLNVLRLNTSWIVCKGFRSNIIKKLYGGIAEWKKHKKTKEHSKILMMN